MTDEPETDNGKVSEANTDTPTAGDSMKNHLWSLVAGRYPEARLVEATKKTVLFTNEGCRWLALFDSKQTKIVGVQRRF